MIHRCTYIRTYHANISTLPRSYQEYICCVSCICIYITYIYYIYIYILHIYCICINCMPCLESTIPCEIFHPLISSEIQHFRIFNISNIKCYLINIVTHGHSVNDPPPPGVIHIRVYKRFVQKEWVKHCV